MPQEHERQYTPPSKKESLSKKDWGEFSYQIGRACVGGTWNTHNPNIANYGIAEWLSLMTSHRRQRKKGVECLIRGISSVAQERKSNGDKEYEIDGSIMPLRNIENYLDNAIKPKIESMVTLLPHPLSPTTPIVSPSFSPNETPFTACTVPSGVLNVVSSPCTSRMKSGIYRIPLLQWSIRTRCSRVPSRENYT